MRTIQTLLIVCVVLLGIIAGKIYYPGEKINQSRATEQRHKIELEQARQYKQYNDNLVRAHTEIVKDLKSEIKNLEKRNSAAVDTMLKDIKNKNEKIMNMGKTVRDWTSKDKNDNIILHFPNRKGE